MASDDSGPDPIQLIAAHPGIHRGDFGDPPVQRYYFRRQLAKSRIDYLYARKRNHSQPKPVRRGGLLLLPLREQRHAIVAGKLQQDLVVNFVPVPSVGVVWEYFARAPVNA
jgi:hypothetical protein